MTQIEIAKSGRISPEMRRVAKDEGVSADFIRKGLISGTIVIPKISFITSKNPAPSAKGLKPK